MVLATVDRIEDDVMVLVTHTEPVQEILLPRILFENIYEGDVVRVVVEKDEDGKEEIEKQIGEMRKEINVTSMRNI
ncbi:hypothetical protein DSECCO2_12300 [anaerobic digester metagenome]